MASRPKSQMAHAEGAAFDAAVQPTAVGTVASARVLPLKLESMPAPVEIPAEIDEKAAHLIENYERYLTECTEAYVERMSEPAPEAGAPVVAGGYQYWNCLTAGPIQFFANPPFRPAKIIAAGELALMLGVVWINPALGPGGSLPGTIVLGARRYRVRFETMNLSTVTNGPDATCAGVFTSPAPIVQVFPRWFVAPDPGVNPQLYECTLTADIVETGQPMAAFSSWHFDLDTEPPFFGQPGMGPVWHYDLPARYLVYRR